MAQSLSKYNLFPNRLETKHKAIALGALVGSAVALVVLTSDEAYEVDPSRPAVISELSEKPFKKDDFYINGTYMGVTVQPFLEARQCETSDNDKCGTIFVNLPEDYVPGSLEIGQEIIIAQDL